jgi:hypothetical protein
MHQFEDKRTDISINWKKPITIEEVRFLQEEKCQDTYFYKIVGHYNGSYKLFYIGKCINQYITTRIFQKDHIEKQSKFKLDHKKHTLMVSLGNLTKGDDYTDSQLGNVENLLIYSHAHEDFSYMKNVQCRLNHNVIENYRITNRGWRDEGMYQAVAYGLFVKG